MSEQTLEEAFPSITSSFRPLGSLVQVQIKMPQAKTKGGIILSRESKDTISDNTQLAKVVKLGPLAFKNRNNGEWWIEGAWVKVGDYVQVPMYGGHRFYQVNKITGEHITFAEFKDTDLIDAIEEGENPLDLVTIKNVR